MLTEYDGGGYSIYNLNLDDNETAEHVSGLFGRTNKDFKVKDLTLINPTSTNEGNHDNALSASSGSIVGSAKKNLTLSKVYLTGTIKVDSITNAGGMVGEVSGNFNCTDSAINSKTLNITSVYTSGDHYTGGFIGCVQGISTIDNSKLIVTSGNIKSSGGSSVYAGGYIGYANASVTLNESSDSNENNIYFNNVKINSESSYQAFSGGFIGCANTDLIMTKMDVYSTQNGSLKIDSRSSQTGGHAGGFAGHVKNKVDCKYSNLLADIYSHIEITSDNISGGIFGSLYNYADIQNSSVHTTYVTVKGNKYVGGVIGEFTGNGNPGTLKIDDVFGYGALGGYIQTNNHVDGAVIGGFIGRATDIYSMDVENSFSCFAVYGDTQSTAIGSAAGGFSGKTEIMQGGEGTISACYSSGHFSNIAEDSQYDVYSGFESMGGFFGSIQGNITVKKCWSTGTVWGHGNTYLGGFGGKVGNGVTVKDGSYTIGTVKSSGTYRGQFIGAVTGMATITKAYYVDKYSNSWTDIPAIGDKPTGITADVGEERRNYYRNILYDPYDASTQTTQTHVWDDSVIPTGYLFKNWINPKETDEGVKKLFYGEWDYRHLPNSRY